MSIRWPIVRLPDKDQAHFKGWQTSPRVTPQLLVRLWEKSGFSPAGTFSNEQNSQPSLPSSPGPGKVAEILIGGAAE